MEQKPLPERFLRLRWFTIGVVLADYLLCRFLTPILALPLGAAALLCFRRGHRSRQSSFMLLGAAMILLWTGSYTLLFLSPVTTLYGTEGEFQAVVLEDPIAGDWSQKITVSLELPHSLPARGTLYLDTEEPLLPGDVIRFSGTITDPTNYNLNLPHSQRAQGRFFAAKKATLLHVDRSMEGSPQFRLQRFRRRVKNQIFSLFSEDCKGFFLALLTGDRSELSPILQDRLERMGMHHIIAVSGLHVSFLLGVFLLFPLPRPLRHLICILPLVFFALFTGGKPSVVRAVVMAACLLLASFFRRDYDPWTALRTALFVLLLHNPFCIEDVGLLLSFLAVAGILLFSAKLYRWFMGAIPGSSKGLLFQLKRYVCSSLSLTLGALSLTIPLNILYFGRISLIALLSNVLTLWAVELGFLLGLWAVVFSFFFPLLAGGLAALAGAALRYVLGTVWLLSEVVPFAAVTSRPPLYLLWVVCVYGVALRWLLLPGTRTKIRRTCLALGMLFLLFTVLHRSFLLSGGLAVQAVDVGQGQSILFLSKDQAVAVDCGGYDAGERLAAEMEDVGEYRLDRLVLTHMDEDHTNGVPLLLERVYVEQVVVPPCPEEELSQLRSLCHSQETELLVCEETERFPFGEAVLEVYPPVYGAEGANNAGLSVLAQKENFSVLITGDMDAETEMAFLREHPVTADVLIVGHHGSASSTGAEFLEAVHPETAIISAGKGNLYNHPAESTLVRLRKQDCIIRRTDLEGSITIKAHQ